MTMRRIGWIALILLVALPAMAVAQELVAPKIDWSGYVEAEARAFVQSPAYPGQRRHSGSLALSPQVEVLWPEGTRLVVNPFARVDSADPNRTHADLREAFLTMPGKDWELGAGFGHVFWGVAESVHLVDIVNQADRVENIDLEDKLGQPMATLKLIRDFGTLDLFYLPFFREQTFPSRKGRLRTEPITDGDRGSVERETTPVRPDVAARFSGNLAEWDYGVSFFHGTSRDPALLPTLDPEGRPVLVPEYDRISQWGLDVQYTSGPWLLKFEGIHRRGEKNRQGDVKNFTSFVGGAEYLIPQVFDTDVDVTLVSEYIRDSRLDDAWTAFENDVFAGIRFALNDVADTTGLISLTQDLDTSSRLLNIEASRRLTDTLAINLEARFFLAVDQKDLLSFIRDDDYVMLTLKRFF